MFPQREQLLQLVFKDIHEMHKDFAFQFLFADLIYGKILNWVTNELLSFYAGSFMNEIFHAYFSLTVKIFYHFFITFPTVFKSLQLLSLFALKCREKKSFCLVQYILCYRNPPIKQTCWQWLAEAQLFRHLWIRL